MLAEDFSALARQRYSVRDFRPDPIPDAVLDAILGDAAFSPSWSNTRPYCLAVASGERKDRLKDAYVKAFTEALPLQRKEPAAILRATLLRRWPDADYKTWGRYPDALRERSVKVGKGLYTHLGIAREDRAARDAKAQRHLEFHGAPTVGFVFVHEGLMPFAALDAGLMLQTLFLSATAHGLGSCALGVLTTWRHPVDAEFDVPKDYKLITGFLLGYPSEHPVNAFRAEHPPVEQARPR
ncbi:nitroreductase [Propioniciclava tarda]|uniref:Nitroreductase n=1 Tax=Propioniciclava tarda TaxID=433330 RepID=A0A4V2JSX3_PROTD|nr:nitroreductase [Propioniciclava tarda]TBT93058.1 nitroreductase [Propioniciclava tarda]SMO79797.1 Nitroreductase [Propioniciclava tarda]